MLARQEARWRREKYSVAVVELRPGDLAPEDGQLVTEHHELQVLRTLGAEAEERKRQDASSQDVGNGQKQVRSLHEPASRRAGAR